MCGIVGAAARRDVVPVLIDGLRKLEYRGYDSCGVAVTRAGGITVERSVERVSALAARLSGFTARTGIAHTRWATHGAPLPQNAHPIVSCGEIAVVHNGIVENHEQLRADLEACNYVFRSETDTEVIAHLVHSLYRGDLLEAVRGATARLRGAYAIALVATSEPDRVVGARAGSPLVVGHGEGGHYLASDASALAATARDIAYLDDGDVISITHSSCEVIDRRGASVRRPARPVDGGCLPAELGAYRHFMQKEIFEQPEAVAGTLRDVAALSPALFGAKADGHLREIESVLLLACGTSYHAALVGRHWLEQLAGMRCSVEVASEYRYRTSVPDTRALVVSVSQSGETADTVAALQHAQSLGQASSLAICNVPTSTMMRMTQLRFLTRAGVEIGVASTKAFTTQLVALFLLALTLAKLRGRLNPDQEAAHLAALRDLPAALRAVLAVEPQVIAWAQRLVAKDHALFLGRGLHYPIALEGALKLKEISYIHAEAYPAGELKHGPLALVTADMPLVAVAPRDHLLEKLKSNLQEAQARGGQLYVLADADTRIAQPPGVNVIRIPGGYGDLSPIVHVVPLQLLAYHAAVLRGTDVDKPRNLAKSVTVE